ncbi:MAG: type 4a pilus biogenesis protein PilO [Phycisphaerales bacterium]|nr:type 4a pilus biogenesis protein PilO [Phycisphaerales bacterium]
MKRRSIEGWVLGATIAAGAALTWWKTVPQWTTGTSLEREIVMLERKIVDLAGAQGTLDEATERLRLAGARQVAECRRVPPVADVAGLMQALSLDVDGHEVHDQTFTVADAPSPLSEHYESLPLQLEVVGAFEGIWDVLERAETLPRLVRVSGLDISSTARRDESPGTRPLRAVLSLDVVYAPPGGE